MQPAQGPPKKISFFPNPEPRQPSAACNLKALTLEQGSTSATKEKLRIWRLPRGIFFVGKGTEQGSAAYVQVPARRSRVSGALLTLPRM